MDKPKRYITTGWFDQKNKTFLYGIKVIMESRTICFCKDDNGPIFFTSASEATNTASKWNKELKYNTPAPVTT